MKILHDGKSYNVESFNLDKDEFLLTNGKKLKEKDIDSMTIDRDNFVFIKEYKKIATRAKKKVEKVIED